MLAIRMRRLGAKKRPFFRIVVIDSHAARDGRALEVLGHYNPATEPETFKVDRQRLDYWTTRGAQPSNTLRTLLKRQIVGAAPPSSISETSEMEMILISLKTSPTPNSIGMKSSSSWAENPT